MIQGPQIVQRALAGIAERPENPPSPAESELLLAAGGPARTEKPSPDDVVTAVTETGKTGAIARTQELRAGLVRAETMLQIAQEAFAAIEVIYAGMRELAELALDENLTEAERATLDAAFQKLKQNIDAILETAVFEGGPILMGGDGPDRAVVIGLPAFGGAGPAPVKFEGFDESNLRTAGSARVAWEGTEKASRIFPLRDHVLEARRAILHQLYAAEIGASQGPGDAAASVGPPPDDAEHLSRLVSDVVRGGGQVPFEVSADRLRGILKRANDGGQPRGLMGGLVRGDELPRKAGLPLEPAGGELIQTRGPAEEAPHDSGAAPRYPTTLDDGLERSEGGEKAGGQAPSLLAGEPPPAPAGANMPAPEATLPAMEPAVQAALKPAAPAAPEPAAPAAPESAAQAAMENIEPGIREIARQPDGIVVQHANVQPRLPAERPGGLPGAQVAIPRHGAGVTPLPGKAVPAPARADLPIDAPVEQFIAAALELNQARNQATAEVRLTELSKIGELDSSRRASGLVHQVREPDTRLEAGLAIAKTVYEAPAGQVDEFGASVPVGPGGFMAELVRADNILHVADLSIEQIDLYLDYLRGLAEEAAADPSRDRAALDEIFQAVKSNIIDTLAQTTEARGERILAGGGGPDGAYVIRLSAGGAAGEGHEIAIPSMRVRDLSPDLFYAGVRTRDAAVAAVGHIELAGADIAETRDMIAAERTLIRRLISMEITQQASRSPLARSALGL